MNLNKLIIPILTILLLSFQITFSQEEFKKLPKEETDSSKIEIATTIANSYFESVKNGNPYSFNDQATDDFKTRMTPELQGQTYQQLKETFGDFVSLEYSATWAQEENDELLIYRFKGYFEDSKKPLEIRVVLNGLNKISGLWVKPWKDNLSDS